MNFDQENNPILNSGIVPLWRGLGGGNYRSPLTKIFITINLQNKMRAAPSNNYYYNPNLKGRAKILRNTMTKSETCLWKHLLSRNKMLGYTFLRQRPVLNYIADFMCKELLLIIEVDGITHLAPAQQQYDRIRENELSNVGFTILRFSSWEVLNRISDVSINIQQWILSQKSVSEKSLGR